MIRQLLMIMPAMILASTLAHADVILSYDFTTGFQGWTAAGYDTFGNPSGSSGWDPGGYIWADAIPYLTARDTTVRFYAPGQFISALPSAVDGSLVLRLISPDTTFLNVHIVTPLDNIGGSGIVCYTQPTLPDWSTVAIPLRSGSGCTIRGVGDPAPEAYVQQTLESATGFYVLGADYNGGAYMAVDEVSLISAVPEPSYVAPTLVWLSLMIVPTRVKKSRLEAQD